MDDTRKQLFTAGIKVFARKGYRDATVREICKEAGSANVNAVNYYFGSKEKLYREILELIFAKYDTFDLKGWDQLSPEAQLKTLITNFCRMLYRENASKKDITAIFVSEMTRPSPFIESLVDQYNRPRIRRHLKTMHALLGDGATDDMARDCLVSVAGQLLYHSFAWPVFSRLFPDYSPARQYEAWAEHVYQFSMGGITRLKENHRTSGHQVPETS
ncbi:MAG: TetR/AcrR family transcriptional regulator [Desulfobacterales bacterium]|nr:TetR/AcrR family transcriptional regulator [Desulfobacterales bacterium]